MQQTRSFPTVSRLAPCSQAPFAEAYALLGSDENVGTVAFITAAGIITGTVLRMPSDDSNELIPLVTKQSSIDYFEKYRVSSQCVPGNDGMILLGNATLQHGSESTHFEYLTVFYDQIIGVTLLI